MFDEDVNHKLMLLDTQLVKKEQQQMVLLETKKDGYAELTVDLRGPAIVFLKLEEKRLKYFCCQKSADHILFQKEGDTWTLHVIEMKRRVYLFSKKSICQ